MWKINDRPYGVRCVFPGGCGAFLAGRMPASFLYNDGYSTLPPEIYGNNPQKNSKNIILGIAFFFALLYNKVIKVVESGALW
ncbi:MAG: hypothetical protein IJL71_06935 [Oscillospiraceae bacterium]|nr:hypothetical protein [Oscillospiraceae bacterium]